jgi:hypothetical protein
LRRPVDIPTAPVAVASLILGYAVAVSSGSRLQGGVVLAAGGLWCMRRWLIRHGPGTAIALGCAGLATFALSHIIALAIGAWPSVLLCSVLLATIVWQRADARERLPAYRERERSSDPGASQPAHFPFP